MKMIKLEKVICTLIFSILVLFLGAVDSCFAQCETIYVALQTALDAMVSDSQVSIITRTVTEWSDPNYYYEFIPIGKNPTEALIIYPGACLDPRAYAILAHDIAAAGYLVAIVPMPSYLAIFGKGRADAVINNHPEIEKWSIGGHSFGGVGACWYVSGNFTYSHKIKGVVLWASYPDSSQPLTNYPIKVISIWGTNDGLTDATDINNSKANLPCDTRYVALDGANHSQFGAYGNNPTDYTFVQPGDNPATITREQQTELIEEYTVSFLQSLTPSIPATLQTVVAEDGSTWEQVSEPGFGNSNNMNVVALCPYQGRLYAITRNDFTGFEIWRTSGSGWEQMLVPGLTDQNNYYGYIESPSPPYTRTKYNIMQNIWGDMIEFNDKLYLAVCSGYQGNRLYGSRGFQIWSFDGVMWEPVVSYAVDTDETGVITNISGCTSNDGDQMAQITDEFKSWIPNQWQGCILRVEAAYNDGTPSIRSFNVISNTIDTLTIRQNEKAATADLNDEYTVCTEHSQGGDPGRPRHIVPGISIGASYSIECGQDEDGFGEIWNKSIVDFEILDGELYATIGLNYADGTRIWKTNDGKNWIPTSTHSFGLFHGYYPDGYPNNPTGFCLIPGTENRNGTPVCSSATKFGRSTVTGSETLFTGGTGSSGCNGRAARVFRLDGNIWTRIVDYFVDENTTGTNENGLGNNGEVEPPPNDCGFSCSNFQAWSWAQYDNLLFTGIVKMDYGARIMYTPSGSEVDGSWFYAVGGDNPLYIDGFGDPTNMGFNLFVHKSALYAGTITGSGVMHPSYPLPLNGADIWRGTGEGTNLNWTRVTGDGFGDPSIKQFEAFCEFENTLYVAASNASASDFLGEQPFGSSGAKIYRIYLPPTVVDLVSFEAIPGKRRVVLIWSTASEIDNAGFNLYRAEAENGRYVKINNTLIVAQGSPTQGATYEYVDLKVEPGKVYYYKLEDVDLKGNSTIHGPIKAIPNSQLKGN